MALCDTTGTSIHPLHPLSWTFNGLWTARTATWPFFQNRREPCWILRTTKDHRKLSLPGSLDRALGLLPYPQNGLTQLQNHIINLDEVHYWTIKVVFWGLGTTALSYILLDTFMCLEKPILSFCNNFLLFGRLFGNLSNKQCLLSIFKVG